MKQFTVLLKLFSREKNVPKVGQLIQPPYHNWSHIAFDPKSNSWIQFWPMRGQESALRLWNPGFWLVQLFRIQELDFGSKSIHLQICFGDQINWPTFGTFFYLLNSTSAALTMVSRGGWAWSAQGYTTTAHFPYTSRYINNPLSYRKV